MFGLGMPELLIILVIVMFIFGANRLPKLGEGLGKSIRSFKQAMAEGEHELPRKDNAFDQKG